MDKIFDRFLQREFKEGMALAAQSDLLELVPVAGDPPFRYIAHFSCRGLIRASQQDDVAVAEHFAIGITFPRDYLRRADTAQVLTWLGPSEIFHPNIRMPFICIGHMEPRMSLVDILYQCFEIITYNKVTMREDDALNHEACRWARHNQDRFPIDKRPLKRRLLECTVEPVTDFNNDEVTQS